MPKRPPREWFNACTRAVAARGGAIDPAAVCGANWSRKSKQERSAIVRQAERPKRPKGCSCAMPSHFLRR